MKEPYDIRRDAIETFGEESQIDMCIEECAELINALEKYRRGRNDKADVITEIADVQIMCEQMQLLFGDTETDTERIRKLSRLARRLQNHKENVAKQRMEGTQG